MVNKEHSGVIDVCNISSDYRIYYLVGMMGTGKTTIGKQLAKHIDGDFIDLDQYIEQSVGYSISEIFARDGEAKFRKLETNALEKISSEYSSQCLVVATGGGAFEKDYNRQIMSDTGVVIWLIASPAEIAKRLANDTTRPLLQENTQLELIDRIDSILSARKHNYQLADLHIVTEGKTETNIIEEIVSYITSTKSNS